MEQRQLLRSIPRVDELLEREEILRLRADRPAPAVREGVH